MPHLEDIVRRGVDAASLITDSCFSGSDTYVTSRILARHLSRQDYDCVFAGTRTLDGGTAHVPAQIAEELNMAHLSNISQVETETLSSGRALVDVDDEDATLRFEVDLPALLGFQYSTKHKLPYIPYEAMNLDTRNRIRIVTNTDLGFDPRSWGMGIVDIRRECRSEDAGAEGHAFRAPRRCGDRRGLSLLVAAGVSANMKKVLIYLDQEVPQESLDLLEASDRMYGRGAYASYGLFVGRRCGAAEGVLDFLVCADDARIAAHDIVNLTNCLEELQIEYGFDAILIAATTFGRMLAPRVAMRLRVGLVAEVTDILCGDGPLRLVRPAFSGRDAGERDDSRRRPVMMSVGRNVFSAHRGGIKRRRPSPTGLETSRARE